MTREIDPVTGCNVGCTARKHPGAQGSKVMAIARTSGFAVATHRLVCHTCGCETSVATGDINPIIEKMFRDRHFPPHHDVLDEHLTDGLVEAGPEDHV